MASLMQQYYEEGGDDDADTSGGGRKSSSAGGGDTAGYISQVEKAMDQVKSLHEASDWKRMIKHRSGVQVRPSFGLPVASGRRSWEGYRSS